MSKLLIKMNETMINDSSEDNESNTSPYPVIILKFVFQNRTGRVFGLNTSITVRTSVYVGNLFVNISEQQDKFFTGKFIRVVELGR